MHFERQNFGITIMKDKDNSTRVQTTIDISKSLKSGLSKSVKNMKESEADIEPWK